MTDREVMQRALEALEEARNKADWIGMSEEGWDKVMQQVDEYVTHRINPAITALRERLAQPEQEPVGWRFRKATFFNRSAPWHFVESLEGTEGLQGLEPLYTTPQPRQQQQSCKGWQGLTDKEFDEIYQHYLTKAAAMERVEVVLREKNA